MLLNHVGEDLKYIHKGLTSSDVKEHTWHYDEIPELILEDLKNLRHVLKRQAKI